MIRMIFLSFVALVGAALVVLIGSSETQPTYSAPESSQVTFEPITAEQLVNTSESVAARQEPRDVAVGTANTPVTSDTTEAAQEIVPEPSLALNAASQQQVPPSIPTEALNELVRGALVNIFCIAGGNVLNPISASGIIIDPRGIILTNAHVGQYFLLEKDPRIDISCSIRTGSPARAHWRAELAYLPTVWIDEHAQQITQQSPSGTGENDFALLRITRNIDEITPLPSFFPHIPASDTTGENLLGTSVLVASYPAGFVSGITANQNLYAASTVTIIRQRFTFHDGTVDLVSLGGIIVAQGGSSGGAVANTQGELVGIVTTSSDGETTAERDLRAVTISHINRSMSTNLGVSLNEFLAGDIVALSSGFQENVAPLLADKLVAELE